MSVPLTRAFILAILVPLGSNAWAWGSRGHHVICEAATFAVKNPELREFLIARSHMMGHLCNIPDIYWKSLGNKINALGRPTHYLDVEVLGLGIDKVPVNFQKIVDEYTGRKNATKEDATIKNIPQELGSIWWRANQFFERAVAVKSNLKGVKAPKVSKSQTNDDHPFNRAIYEFVTNLGLMGHFVGDASMPFHNTADFDGWSKGHGGIHSYYEERLVDALPIGIAEQILREAESLQRQGAPFLTKNLVVEKLRRLSEVSYSEINSILELDPIQKNSESPRETGLRTVSGRVAERSEPGAVVAQFKPLLVKQMARATALLAALWDDAYEKVGKPDLKAYQSYKYPLAPEFVPPDYFKE